LVLSLLAYSIKLSLTIVSPLSFLSDDEGAIRGIRKKPRYLAKQFIQLRTNWYSLETGLSEKKGASQ